MWSAIKNDLFEFVQTVQSDTQSTLAKVIDPRTAGLGVAGGSGGYNNSETQSEVFCLTLS
jgi:hypothetical protein